jgi:predicted TIM-barrel fold metal-dependent hydrolase
VACAVGRWTVVFGGKARLSGVWASDAEVAAYAEQHPDRLIGFLSVDPTKIGWQDDLIEGHQNLKLKGIKLLPMYAGFHPNDPQLGDLWQYGLRHNLPVLLHTGTTFIDKSPLQYTRPHLIDNVAIRCPDVKIIPAHLGHPYEGQCVVVIRKHANAYANSVPFICTSLRPVRHGRQLAHGERPFTRIGPVTDLFSFSFLSAMNSPLSRTATMKPSSRL